MIWYVLFFIGLLGVSAFFSSLETAYTSLSIHQIHYLSEKRGRRGRKVKQLTERSGILLTTILIGNDLANIGAASVVTLMTEQLFGARAVSAASGLLTLIVLIFCEVTPKRIAIAHNQTMALNTAFLLYYMGIVLRPIILLITWFSSLITRFFTKKSSHGFSLDSIINMIKAGETKGVVKEYESRMVRSIFRLDDISAQTVMTPRADVYTIDRTRTIAEIAGEIAQKAYSRVPVFDTDPENIVGILLAKDILKEMASGRTGVSAGEVMKRAIFAPEAQKIDTLFARFQAQHLEMAIVLDEYGGFAGVVTLEDIAEEVFGEIYDETDKQADETIVMIGKNRYRVQATATLPVMQDQLGFDLSGTLPDQTLGAYILEKLEHLPVSGEELQAGKWRLSIEEVRNKRIISVILSFDKSEDGGDN